MKRLVPLLLMLVVVASGCFVNQGELWPSDKLSPDAPALHSPDITDIQYGPEPLQHLDVYQSHGPSQGVIVYLHAGGWCCGDHVAIDRLLLQTLDHGFTIVSVDYRLAPVVHAPEIASDVDRAIRYVKAHRAEWNAGDGKVLIAGGSAGGHLALLAASAPGLEVAPDLPPELLAQGPVVDGVIAFSAPNDLRPYINDEIAPFGITGLAEDFLGCSNRGRFSTPVPGQTQYWLPRCSDEVQLRYSPTFWAWVHAPLTVPLPPLFLATGLLDGIVPRATQVDRIQPAWEAAAGYFSTYVDLPPLGGHNLSGDMNRTAFMDWWLPQFVR